MSSKKIAREYYSSIAPGYDELYGEEQLPKFLSILGRIDFQMRDIVLDIGCGTGLLVYLMCGKVSRVVGIDLSRGMIEMRRRCSSGDFLICDAENLPFRGRIFDKVFSFTAFQNLENPSRMLEEVRRVCRGKAAITVLGKGWSLEKFKELVSRFITSCEAFYIGKDIVCIGDV
ncbi:MAG: class I SAM-dependent methyltransferase [Thermoproteota archaeon]